MRAVKGITELITRPGLVNLDFADVESNITKERCRHDRSGRSRRREQSLESVQKALRSPLLDVDVSGATSALVNVVGGPDMTIAES